MLFSDGGFEVADAAGSLLGYDAFAELVTEIARNPHTAPPQPANKRLEAIVAAIGNRAGGGLSDDFAILEAWLA